MKRTTANKIFRYRLRLLIESIIGPATTHTIVDPGPESRYVVVTIFGRDGRVKRTQQVKKQPLLRKRDFSE
jgi:hypothetical protein